MSKLNNFIVKYIVLGYVTDKFLYNKKSIHRTFFLDIGFLLFIFSINFYYKKYFILMLFFLGFFYFFKKQYCFIEDISNEMGLIKTYSVFDMFNTKLSVLLYFLNSKKKKEFLITRISDEESIFERKEKHYNQMKYFDYENLFNSGTSDFLLTYFNRNEKTLINFFNQRLKNHYGNFQHNFVFYSLSIPFRKTMSVDCLKEILINNQFPPNETFIPDYYNFGVLLNNNISDFFINYSEKDIRKILTKYYDWQDYIKMIGLIQKHECVLPLFNSIEEILYYLEKIEVDCNDGSLMLNQEESFDGINNLLGDFYLNNDKFSFHIMENMKDVYSWGNALKNCLEKDNRMYKNLTLNGEAMLLGIYKNKKKYGAMCVDCYGNVIELKIKMNRDFPNEERNLIMNHFKLNYLEK